MAEVSAAILTIILGYIVNHLDDIIFTFRQSPDRYHTDWNKLEKDLRHDKNKAMKNFNKGAYDVKDK